MKIKMAICVNVFDLLKKLISASMRDFKINFVRLKLPVIQK